MLEMKSFILGRKTAGDGGGVSEEAIQKQVDELAEIVGVEEETEVDE